MQFKNYANFHEILWETVEKYAKAPAYRWFDANARATSLTWQEFYDQVKAVSKSLIALTWGGKKPRGVSHGSSQAH